MDYERTLTPEEEEMAGAHPDELSREERADLEAKRTAWFAARAAERIAAALPLLVVEEAVTPPAEEGEDPV